MKKLLFTTSPMTVLSVAVFATDKNTEQKKDKFLFLLNPEFITDLSKGENVIWTKTRQFLKATFIEEALRKLLFVIFKMNLLLPT